MLKSFLTDRAGNFGIIMGVVTLPLLLAVGFAVDYSRYLSAESHLQELADVASLALASSREKDKEKLEEIADDFIASNIGVSSFDVVKIVDLDIDDDEIDLDLTASIDTYFMGLANVDTLDVRASALAERAVTGSVEVALVLDNTDSMNIDNKIGTLKIAAADLVKKLHENDEAEVRIALVPYGEQINVGTGNRNASWLSVPDNYSTTKTTTRDGYWYQPMKNTNECETWREAGSREVEKDGVWVTESWPRACSRWKQVTNGEPRWIEPEGPTTTVTNYNWHGCIGSRVSASKLVLDDQSPSVKYPGFLTTGGANKRKCLTEILPLTGSEDKIENAIEGMITSRSGYTPQTYIPAGMIWGVNLLSPSEPFTEGAAYDLANKDPRKVIVLMTDGLNTRRVVMSGGSMGDYTSANDAQRIQTNTDTTTICNYAKAQKIEIYTVAFRVDDAAAKAMLQGCATDSAHYYDATDADALLLAFAGIAESLSQVRLAR